NKEALFIIGNGILVTATEVDKKIYELRQTELKKGNSGEKLMQMSNNGYFTPRPSYVWEDASKDQTGPDGNVEYLLDEKGEIKETPRGEYGDLANFALYVILEQNGIDLVNVGMVSPKSHDTYKARYEFLPDALKAFNQQQQAFGDRNIVFPTGYFQPE
ncbi:MAG: hypothetical protein KDD40_02260, partial [Bdellovibrionales bacterium]|nr:hypothetical protein [Bdellovibrionales bacterium]